MDFGTLLQTARKNEVQKKEVRSYSTKFAPPKKEDKKDKVLSANIQKFLARKENEEKRKATEANKKRDDLLALRSKDKKATRRVNVMLKRTKSANQSVIDDAVDNDNTAVTLAGPAQPDEDDYGYVSQEASAFYNKMMEKYNKMPEEQKFPDAKKKASSNLSSTKDRVRAALEKEKLEAMLPHRRKRKHKEGEEQEGHDDDDDNNNDEEDEVKCEPPPKVKPKNKMPPPMNFTELLRLASQKQHEPIMIEVKPKDEGVLFTKKQKQELEKEQQRRSEIKGKLTVDQIDAIRKLPPSHLYKTKRSRENREISRSEVYDNDDDSPNEFEETPTNRIPKVQNENDKFVKPSREDHAPNRLPTKYNEGISDARMSKTYSDRVQNGAPALKTYSERPPKGNPHDERISKTYSDRMPNEALTSKTSLEGRPKASNDERMSKTYPNDAQTSKSYLERPPKVNNVSNDERVSKPYPDRVPHEARTSKTSFERPPKYNNFANDERGAKSYPDRAPNESRTSKTSFERPPKHNDVSNDERVSKPYPDRVPNESRTSKTSFEKPPKHNNVSNDERVSKSYPDRVSNEARTSKTSFERPSKYDNRMSKTYPSNEAQMSKTYLEKSMKPKEVVSDARVSKMPNDTRLSKGDSKVPIVNRSKEQSLSNKFSNDNRPSKNTSEKPRVSTSVPNDNRFKTSNPPIKPSVHFAPQKPDNSKFKEPSSKLQSRNGLSHVNKNTAVQNKPVPPDDRRLKQLPPKDLKPKQFPPPDVMRRKEVPTNNVRSKPQMANKRRIIDDEEEYDSEMDDFIDDGPEETDDYSTYIRQIFGYDKRKFKEVDEDDVDNMETTFAQQMREDVRSAKIGLMEDLEDIQREKEEKRRKALKKKGRL